MKSRAERSRAGGQQKMEGVNMPASYKFAWRRLVGATAAAIFVLAALPGVGHTENIEICIGTKGKVKGINLGSGGCNSGQTEIDWVTQGPPGYTGMAGVVGNPGIPGEQGPAGLMGLQGPPGAQGAAGPQGPEGVEGPTGPTGPLGFMGPTGVMGDTGVVGVTGPTGATGAPGIAEPNISVFTGGTLGTLGNQTGGAFSIALSGDNSVGSPGTILILGPGNGADESVTPEVPISEAGTAERLFVAVDNDPGTQMNNGLPSSFVFFLCDGNAFPGSCGLTCVITGPQTACSDLTGSQVFAQGDFMSLWAYATYPGANTANVKWSVTYDHGAAIIVPTM
jgi:hypothetical protein